MGHLKRQHRYVVEKGDRAELEELCKSRGVHTRAQDVPVPRAGGPPVQGIAPPVEGLSCTADPACEYSVQDLQTMLRHCRENHGQGLLNNSKFRKSMVQSMFPSVGHVYFEVDPAATLESNLDVRRYLRGTFLPAHASDPVVPQDSDRDRAPLLKITLWDEFERDIRSDADQREAARVIKAKHTAGEHGGIFVSLKKVVKRHHATTRALLNGSSHSFTIAKVLLNGPGLSPEQ